MTSIIRYLFGYIPYGNDILHAINNKMFYSDSVYSDENYLEKFMRFMQGNAGNLSQADVTANKNFLSPVGFTFKIDQTNFANLEYFCTQVTFPGISLAEVQVPYRGVNLAQTGDRMVFDDLAIRFNINENMENYLELFNWMHNIINKGDAEAYKYDASLLIMSSHNNMVKTIKFQSL